MLNLASGLPAQTILRLDGILCLVMGTALLSFAQALGVLTDLPGRFLMWAGAALVPIGLFILAVALLRELPRSGILVTVVGNAAWAVASFASVTSGFVSPRLVRGGAPYAARFALRLTVEEGRITRHHVYEDSLSVRRAWAHNVGEMDSKL